MPEYLAPGVYVEETSFRAKSIEGVSTSTTAFVGPTRKGPLGEAVFVSSFGDFERIFGGFEALKFGDSSKVNYLAHAVKNYFDNGGARLFVSRVMAKGEDDRGSVSLKGANDKTVSFTARTPGSAGNGQVMLSLIHTELPLDSAVLLDRAPVGALLVVSKEGEDDSIVQTLYIKESEGWFELPRQQEDESVDVAGLSATKRELVSVNVLFRDDAGNEFFYENLGLAPDHPRAIQALLAETPDRAIDRLEQPYAITGDIEAPETLYALLAAAHGKTLRITGGRDGKEPAASDYEAALSVLAGNDEIAIVAAPGYSDYAARRGIQEALLKHVETRRSYRFAVLDTRKGGGQKEALQDKSFIDSSYAALYYPWVVVANPLARAGERELLLPPSGFVCGIFARNDINRSVAKSPANEVVRGAIGLERNVTMAEQELLNPRGVNCLRFFPGRGYRLWGARTASSDPEWKYIGPRRYFLYLEHSIDRSTQWAVFENNGSLLWANIREAVSSFLYNEWRSGNLLGGSPEEAFFVRCDRSTMTQNDLDNGRLVCLIGVAVLKPAEFVIFRIGQKTADARD